MFKMDNFLFFGNSNKKNEQLLLDMAKEVESKNKMVLEEFEILYDKCLKGM